MKESLQTCALISELPSDIIQPFLKSDPAPSKHPNPAASIPLRRQGEILCACSNLEAPCNKFPQFADILNSFEDFSNLFSRIFLTLQKLNPSTKSDNFGNESSELLIKLFLHLTQMRQNLNYLLFFILSLTLSAVLKSPLLIISTLYIPKFIFIDFLPKISSMWLLVILFKQKKFFPHICIYIFLAHANSIKCCQYLFLLFYYNQLGGSDNELTEGHSRA